MSTDFIIFSSQSQIFYDLIFTYDNFIQVNKLLKYLKPQTFDSAESEKRRMFPCFVEKLKEMDKLPAIFFL